jgi:hypothetical protein
MQATPDELVGTSVLATVERVEAYGGYFTSEHGRILVLIIHIGSARSEELLKVHPPDLRRVFQVGEGVVVELTKYIAEEDLFMGTMDGLLPG